MNQRRIAFDILYRTIKDESYSNLLMRKELNKLPPINRGFVTNIVNGVLRKFEYLEFQLKNDIDEKTNFKLKLILIMALFERFYLDEKDYVVNNEYVDLCDNKYDRAFVNAVLHKVTELKKTNNISAKYCLPEWIYTLLSSQYEEDELLKILDVYQKIPEVYYRINRNKCNFDDLSDLGIVKVNDDIFKCDHNLISTTLYKQGYFYIQDYNSASLYKNLDLEYDNSLLDVCSAPGSKAFNCVELIKQENCYCNDLYPQRVELIKKMAERLGYTDINYLCMDGTKICDTIHKKFDRILLDVPCSGLGVIGRKPDLKFHIKPESLDQLQKLQYDLLSSNSKMLNDYGVLLYSTCTLNKKENSRLIRKFLSENLNFELLKEETIINDLGDCFYYAKLTKVN